MARDGAASRRAVRRVSAPDASGRLVRTVSPSQIAPSDGGARARRLVARRRGGALLTGLHTDLCTGARAKKTPHLALRARGAGNKKAHTGVAVWAFTLSPLSRYRAGAGGLFYKVRGRRRVARCGGRRGVFSKRCVALRLSRNGTFKTRALKLLAFEGDATDAVGIGRASRGYQAWR